MRILVVEDEAAQREVLSYNLEAEGIEVYVIGDALVPRNLSSAVHDGYRIGLRI